MPSIIPAKAPQLVAGPLPFRCLFPIVHCQLTYTHSFGCRNKLKLGKGTVVVRSNCVYLNKDNLLKPKKRTMKKAIFLSTFFSVFLTAAAFSQKYKSAADSFKLNKEYASVSKDVADLQLKLAEAQKELPDYQSKASDAQKNAEGAAQQSNSTTATTDVGDAKKAKKNADKAYKEAKSSEKAQEKVKDQQKKIDKLNKELADKQQRLQELETMRTSIRSGQ